LWFLSLWLIAGLAHGVPVNHQPMLPPGNAPEGQAHSQASLVFDTILVGYTQNDNQQTASTPRQVELDSTGRAHMVWTEFDSDPLISRIVYNSWFGGVLEYGINGCLARPANRPLYPSLAIGESTAVFTNSEWDVASFIPVFNWDSASCEWRSTQVSAPYGQYLSSRVATQWLGDTLVTHIASHAGRLLYWRSVGDSIGSYQVADSRTDNSYQIAVSPVSSKVAIVCEDYPTAQILCYESDDAGYSWTNGEGFTQRCTLATDLVIHKNGIAAVYDYDDNLHVVFQESAPFPFDSVALRHWSAASGLNTVVEVNWDYSGIPSGLRNLNHPQLAVGTGTRLNNLYLVWDQYGDLISGADTSAGGTLNAGIYLAMSTNGGVNWDRGRNLIDAPSPGCAGDCNSEVFPYIAPNVDSLVHILFIRDLEAGPFTAGMTDNPIYYMRLQTPEADTAPIMSGVPSSVGPVFLGHAFVDTARVKVRNIGTASLEFTFSHTISWLHFEGSPGSYSGVLPSGASDEVRLILDPLGLDDGTHLGTVLVSSNDPFVDGTEFTVEIIVSSSVIASFRFGITAGTDCWGWTGPDGTEYAIMGVEDGIAFVNTSTFQIIEIVPGPGPCGFTWRDIKTYRNYCYAVSECVGTNQGLMTMDLQYLPDSVHYIGSYTSASGITSHNLSIDTATGYAYMVDPSADGFCVVDLADPESPIEYPAVPTGDLHDMFARNDTVWAAEGYESSFSVWDLSDKNAAQLIARVSVPGDGYVHNIWPSEDGRYVVTTEETTDKTVKIWDTQNMGNIQLVGQYLGPSQLVHNAHVEGDYIVMSHYASGVRIVDFSVPAAPVEVAAVDTYPKDENPDFVGCWGVFPHTPSGHVYASNLDGTLFILQFDSLLAPDGDDDGIPDAVDNCPLMSNPDQADGDGDDIGDVCDNCPTFPNPDQIGCPSHGDVANGDGVFDALDLNFIIDHVFSGGAQPTRDSGCPHVDRGDVNCDGVDDVLDVGYYIDLVFYGGPEPCNPCACNPYPVDCM
jgi:choice-of-anchor B domain-containing protein